MSIIRPESLNSCIIHPMLILLLPNHNQLFALSCSVPEHQLSVRMTNDLRVTATNPRASALCSFTLFSHFFVQHALSLRTGLFMELLEDHRKLRTDAKRMRGTFASKYNEVSAEKKVLEDQLNELAGKFILRLTQPLSDLRLSILYPKYGLTEPRFAAERNRMQEERAAELAKLKSSHNAEVAKLKAAHEAKVAQLVACHEEELEKLAAEVLEAKNYAQKVHRTHQFAKRDYERAKTSSALRAERMKGMEAAEKG